MSDSKAKRPDGPCECCACLAYDEDAECWVCDAELDEDDAERFLASGERSCPFFRLADEYKVVEKQALSF